MGMAVHPADGRIAVFEAWYPDTQRYGVIDLVIFDGTDRLSARLPGVSLLRTTEGFPLAVDAEWLPDGRVAFTRYVAQPGADRPVARLAPADPDTDRTWTAPQPHPNCRIGPLSPDGGWLAAEYGEPHQVGVLPPGADSRQALGRGTLVG